MKNKRDNNIESKSKSPFKLIKNKSIQESINKKENKNKFKTIINK